VPRIRFPQVTLTGCRLSDNFNPSRDRQPLMPQTGRGLLRLGAGPFGCLAQVGLGCGPFPFPQQQNSSIASTSARWVFAPTPHARACGEDLQRASADFRRPQRRVFQRAEKAKDRSPAADFTHIARASANGEETAPAHIAEPAVLVSGRNPAAGPPPAPATKTDNGEP